MPALHQEPNDMVVVGKIREVLEQRIGADRFGLWFADRVRFEMDASILVLQVQGEFALERLKGKYLRAVESAAAEVLQRVVAVRLQLAEADVQPDGAEGAMLAIAVAPAEAETSSLQAAAALAVTVAKKETHSPTETLARRRQQAEKSSNSGSSQNRSGDRGLLAAKGPAPFADLLVSAATHPRHSSGYPSNHHQAPRATTIAASQPDSCAQQDSRAQSDSRRQIAGKAAKSIRVTSAPSEERQLGDAGSERERAAELGRTGSLGDAATVAAGHPQRPSGRGEPMTFGTFVTATSNTLATTAAQLLSSNPANAAPLCFWGATGTGKTHLLSAIRHELRTRHRLPRVILLSAEEFTNDFLSCVRGTGLPAFRKRYRDVDALLIDNVQFLGGKSATLREMLYTVDAILSRRRPLVLAGDRQPLEIEGLSGELAGRMSSGLVCGINPMEMQLRRELYHRHAQRCFLPWDDSTIDVLAERTVGDGRVIQGISQLVSMLQRMYRRMPTLQEITAHAGDMLQRGPKVVALADVERAVCSAFGLSLGDLKSASKSRNVSQPRILAMYLSRQHTTAAFAEIGRYYGDRNHSTVIAAHRRVETWLKDNQPVGGRGPKNMKALDAIAAVENLLRIG